VKTADFLWFVLCASVLGAALSGVAYVAAAYVELSR
jgi:hypothetical protein